MAGATIRSTGWMNAEDLATMVQRCDIVAFKRRFYVHYALVIQVTDDGVVWLRHYAPDEDENGDGTRRAGDFRLSAAFSGGSSAKAHVRCDSLIDVAEGCLGRIDNSLDLSYPPLTEEEILQRAHSRLGESSYHLAKNNCEHFVRWCRNGVHRSGQVNTAVDYANTAATVVGNGYAAYRTIHSLRSAADLLRSNNRLASAAATATGGVAVAAAGTTGGTAAVASGGIAAAASSWTAYVSGSAVAAASSLAGGVSAAAVSVGQAAARSSMMAAVSGQAAAIGSSVSGAMASAAGVFGGGGSAAAAATTTGGGAAAGGTAAMVALPLIGGIAAVGGTYYVLKRLKARKNRNDLQRLLGEPEEKVAKPESNAKHEHNEVHDDYSPELFE
ncbi:NC domain containing protein [Aphelenchoides avenae]|nr:NC domain containing protein [Aphelenchus avenae]